MIDIKAKYPEARELPQFAGGQGNEVWREIARTSHDQDPCGRFIYCADKLIAEDRFRERTLEVMRAIRERCYAKDGVAGYRIDGLDRLDEAAFVEARKNLDGVGAFDVARLHELVPRHGWMSREQWNRAFRRYVETMTLEDRATNAFRAPLVGMFGGVPTPDLAQFELPARGVLTGDLVHKPLMGDLAHLLALVAAIAAANYQDAFYRAAAYVEFAAKMPPLVVAREDGGLHLIHVAG